MFVEVGSSDISPPFTQILQLLFANKEYLAFAPDTEETSTMLSLLSLKFPLLKVVNHFKLAQPVRNFANQYFAFCFKRSIISQ